MNTKPGWRLKVRRRVRSLPPVRAVGVLRQVVAHPSNRGHRLAAVRRSIAWQFRSRTNSDPVDLVVYGGLTLRAYPRSNSASNVIYFTPYFDPDEMAFLEHVLEKGDTFVDCGANIGTYSLLAASLVGPSGRVVSYEPSTLAAGRLEENVQINSLGSVVRVRHAAIGAERGFARITSGSDVSNSIVSSEDGCRRTEEVEMVALDPIEIPFDVAVVKIDVEGYEMEALRGMSALLEAERKPILLMELTPHLLRRAGSSATEVAAHLVGLGYALYVYSVRRHELVDVDVAHIERAQANYLAVPNERVDGLRRQLREAT